MKKTFDKKLKLEDIVTAPNVAELLSEDDLTRIASEALQGYTVDRNSMEQWLSKTKEALKLIELDCDEIKVTPFVGAANVKYPLATTAVIQFAARQFGNIIRGNSVAAASVKGADPTGMKNAAATRVTNFMSYQLLYQMTEWASETDKSLGVLAAVGTLFKKTYYCPIEERNISELCKWDSITVNNGLVSLEKAFRISHSFVMARHDLIKQMRSGLYLELTDDELEHYDVNAGPDTPTHAMIEQHTYLDLDGDGFPEPYIIVLDETLEKVVRIVARFNEDDIKYNTKDQVVDIREIHYFTDFHFIYSPSGEFFSLGLGILLHGMQSAVNSLINQTIDSASLANSPGGLIDNRIKIKGGQIIHIPGQYQKVDLFGIDDMHKHIKDYDFKPPSGMVFDLLNVLMQGAKDLSSMSDALLGQEHVQNVAASTLMSQIQQGSQVITAVQRRYFNSLKKEFNKLFRLNRIFLDEEFYYRFNDMEDVVLRKDFDEAELDVFPVADPNMSTIMEKDARNRAIFEFLIPLGPESGIDYRELSRRVLEDLETPNIDALQPPKQEGNEPPPIEILEWERQKLNDQLTHQDKQRGRELEEIRSKMDGMLKEMEMKVKEAEYVKHIKQAELYDAQAVKTLEEAKAVAPSVELDYFKQQSDTLRLIQQGENNEREKLTEALIAERDPESNFGSSDVDRVMEIPNESGESELGGDSGNITDPTGAVGGVGAGGGEGDIGMVDPSGDGNIV